VAPVRHLHDHPAACVIAQQYSSSTSTPLSFGSSKEKFGARLKMSLFHFFLLTL
jgi:hypothetical protein